MRKYIKPVTLAVNVELGRGILTVSIESHNNVSGNPDYAKPNNFGDGDTWDFERDEDEKDGW